MTNTRQQSKARLKQNAAIALRATGMGYRGVTEQLNAQFGTNHKEDYIRAMVSRALRENPPEGVEDLRNLEAMRLDNIQARLMADFQRPTPQLAWEIDPMTGERKLASLSFDKEDTIMRTRAKVADTMLKLFDRRAKLFGIDALPADAAPVDVTVSFSPEVAIQPMTAAVVDIPRGEE